MLSPKAMKRVTPRSSGVSATEKVHAACRPCASLAVQTTGVAPVLNLAPEAGAHVVETGSVPPSVVGGVKVTSRPPPGTPGKVTSAGQVIVGASTGGGMTGLWPQPLTAARAMTTHVGSRRST